MSIARLCQFILVRLLPVMVLGLLGARALAQADPPSRVGRMNHLEGQAVFAPAGDNEWVDAALNRPLVRGDRLWTDRGSRADIQVGSSAVRLDGLTHLEILALDDKSAQLSVTQGSVFVRVRSLPEGENFEIDTPNLAYRAAYPGDYRVDVDAARGTTRVTIHSGTGAVYGEGGQVLPLGGGQQITFKARDLSQTMVQESPPQDNFDRWAAERNRREDQSVSARYVPREVVGYQQLDAHGQWVQDATWGHVWIPQGVAAQWAPYRNGHWEWIGPWGWTWIDDAPWGFAPFHYGRWALVNSRWAWVPGRIGLKPVYAPALVAFVGGAGGGIGWALSIGSAQAGVAWFPLAPGEPWQPGYTASPVYLNAVNGSPALPATAAYAHRGKPEALTSIPAEDFHRGKPVRANWMRLAANALTSAPIVPPPPMPQRAAMRETPRVAAARPAPPAAPKAQGRPQAAANPAVEPMRVVAAVAAPGPAPAASAGSAGQAKRAAQVKSDQARGEPARAIELARREKLAQRAERARRDQQAAKLAEQAKRDLLTRRAEQTRREQAARQNEKAQREQQARRSELAQRELAAQREQARREQMARRAEQAKRDTIARREEQQRREAHARQVEQTRRAADRDAQALREARVQREEIQAKREAQERERAQQHEQAQRAAWERQQQVLTEQWRRDQQAWEQQQRERARVRPDLRDDRRSRLQEPRGIPIIGAGQPG